MGGAALRRAAVAAHWVAVVDHRMHRYEAGEGDAERADDLSAHGFGHGSCSTGGAELQHGVAYALLDTALADAEVSGDFLGGEALGDIEDALQFARRQASAEMAYPCADGDRIHDVLSRLSGAQGFAQLKDKRGRQSE
ncbi:hypothetical protein D3C76_828480 [compost metagenome]